MYFMLICTLLIVLSEAKQTYVDAPSVVSDTMLEKSFGCIEETGADSEILWRLFLWQFDDSETSKKFNFCLFKSIGLINDAGHFYVDKVLFLYEYSDQKDEVAKISEECNKVVDKVPYDTMYNIFKCFYLKTPVLLQVKKD